MARYAILSDVHGNLEALEAVLSDANRQRIDGIWYLGDTVVYGPNPNECLQRLKEALGDWPGTAVLGNNDEAILKGEDPDQVLDDWLGRSGSTPHLDNGYRTFREATSACHRWTLQNLTAESMSLLEAVPDAPRPVLANAVLLHASPCEPVGKMGNYITAIPEAEEAFVCLKQYALCFYGHTHRMAVFRETVPDQIYDNCEKLSREELTFKRLPLDDRRLLINPGSVGQPRDGDSRAAFAVLDADEGYVEFRRVDYSSTILHTLRKIQEAGLPDALAERLKTGI